MSIERLSGGLTPADGSDPRTFPEIFNGFADEFEGKNIPAFGTAAPSDGDALVYNDADGVYEPGPGGGLPSNAYAFVETVYFTSSGTFSKGDYPWLRAIRVKTVGGGGAGGGVLATSGSQVAAASGGAGGSYSESFITDIGSLGASVTVTRGAGGAGVSGGVGNVGVQSSFGSLVTAPGGGGGSRNLFTGPFIFGGADRSSTGTGDLVVAGTSSGARFAVAFGSNTVLGGAGGHSVLGAGGSEVRNGVASPNVTFGSVGGLFGGGGGGQASRVNSVAGTGVAGGNGIVIVDLFA